MDLNMMPLVIAIIIAGTSFLLAHLFNDSDFLRRLCCKLRAKYILTNISPQDYVDMEPEDIARNAEIKADVIRDYLRYRVLQIHFGIVNLILIGGSSILIGILAVLLWHLLGIDSLDNKHFYPMAIFSLILIYFAMQITFALQNQAISRRISQIDNHVFPSGNNFTKDCDSLWKLYPLDKNLLFKLTKATNWFYLLGFTDSVPLSSRCWEKEYLKNLLYRCIPVLGCLILDITFITIYYASC